MPLTVIRITPLTTSRRRGVEKSAFLSNGQTVRFKVLSYDPLLITGLEPDQPAGVAHAIERWVAEHEHVGEP